LGALLVLLRCKTKKSINTFAQAGEQRRSCLKNSLAPPSSLPILQRWTVSICGSFDQKGAAIAYVRPSTTQGRNWLWDQVKYAYVGINAIVQAEQLPELIQRMDADELRIHWQS
jgi:hypothetical protein